MGRGPALGRVADPSAYLDGLKGQLGITAAQATSWDAFAEVVKAQAAQMLNLHRTMGDAMPTATWGTAASFLAVQEAALKLEPALTAGQRTKAADILPGLSTPGPMGPSRQVIAATNRGRDTDQPTDFTSRLAANFRWWFDADANGIDDAAQFLAGKRASLRQRVGYR